MVPPVASCRRHRLRPPSFEAHVTAAKPAQSKSTRRTLVTILGGDSLGQCGQNRDRPHGLGQPQARAIEIEVKPAVSYSVRASPQDERPSGSAVAIVV